MPRQIFGVPAQTSISPLPTAINRPAVKLTAAALEARLRQKRASTYVDAMQKLDTCGHIHSPEAVAKLLAAITQEFPDIELAHLPLGIVARCYLGHPFEVHTLDYAGQIVQHYKNSESLPALLARARSLAMHSGYAFVEVYPEQLIAVAQDGTTSLVKG